VCVCDEKATEYLGSSWNILTSSVVTLLASLHHCNQQPREWNRSRNILGRWLWVRSSCKILL